MPFFKPGSSSGFADGGVLYERPENIQAKISGQAALQRRVNLLSAELPGLRAQPDVVLQLAKTPGSDADMIESAIAAIGFSEVHKMAEELRTWDPIQASAEWGAMSPMKQRALQSAGYVPPPPPVTEEPKKNKSKNPFSKSFWKLQGETFVDTLQAPLKALGMGVNAAQSVPVLGKGVEYGLKGMAYPLQEVSRINRANTYLNDADETRAELAMKGIDADAFSAKTGVFLPGGQGGRRDTENQLPLSGPLAPGVKGMLHPLDYAKTWNKLGHNGEDDFLPSRQLDAFELLDNYDSSTSVENLNIARALASGKQLDDIAESAGFAPGTPEYQEYVNNLAGKTADPVFKQALDTLAGAKISYGRTLARGVGFEDSSLSHGPGKWVSGSFDAAFSILLDPTLAGGKISKSARAARWSVRSGEAVSDIGRAQKLASLWRDFEAGADVSADLSNFSRRSPLAARSVSLERDLLAEGKAVNAAAGRIAQAWDPAVDYSIGDLVRELPQTAPAIDRMRDYHNALKASGGEGLTTADAVFDFYKDTAAARAIAQGEGKSIGAAMGLFGSNPQNLIIPNLTPKARAMLRVRQGFRTALIDGKGSSQLADDVVAAAKEAGDIPKDFDVDMNWVPEPRSKAQQFTSAFTTLTAGKQIPIEGATATRDFQRLVEYGSYVDMPRLTKDRYVSLWAEGNVAQRASLVNQFLADFMSHAGQLDEAGQALMEKYLGHARQAYGIGQQLKIGEIGLEGAKAVLTRDAVFSSQLADHVAIPSFKELLDATSQANQLRATMGGIRNSHFEALMARVWKPVQMMRLGFITRNAGEEVATFMARNSAGDYLRAKIASDWAQGLKGAGAGLDPRLAQSAWLRPVTGATYGLRRMLGVGEEAVLEAGLGRAMALPEYRLADDVGREALVREKASEVLADRKFIPRSVARIDDAARTASMFLGEGFHQIAQTLHIPSKVEIGETLLRGQVGNEIKQGQRFIADSPVGDLATRELGVNTYRQASSVEIGERGLQYTLFQDPSNPKALTAVPMRADRSAYVQYAHDNPNDFYYALNQRLNQVGDSVQGRAGNKVMSRYLNPSTKEELAKVFGGDGAAKARELRNAVMSATDADKDLLREWLKKAGKPSGTFEDEALEEAAKKLRKASTRTKAWLSPDASPHIVDDAEFLRSSLADSISNALGRLDSEHLSRSMIRLNAGVENALPSGVSRLYLPMVDRHAMEGVAAVLSTKEGADAFAKNLEANLSRRGLKGQMSAVWDATTPGHSGWSVSDMMDAVKGKQIVSGGEWVPTAMAASSNHEVALALRDAMASTLEELGSPQLITPTIGHIDLPSGQLTPDWGVHPLGDTGVFHVDPAKAVTANPIDPNNMTTFMKVKMPDGEQMWLAEHEVDQVAGPLAQSNIEVIESPRLKNFAEYDPRSRKLAVNPAAVAEDWNAGATYLRGEGKNVSRRLQGYTYADENAALELGARLDQLEFNGAKFPDLGELVSKYRGVRKELRQDLRDGAEWVLRDKTWGPLHAHGILDEVLDVAATATTSKGQTRVVTATVGSTSSKAMRAALERQGVDVDKLVDQIGSAAGYREFLVEREKAKLALSHRKTTPGTELTPEALHVEMQANAQALRATGVDPEAVALAGRTVEMPPFSFAEGNGVQVLDSIVGSSQTEATAIRLASETAADNIIELLASKGEVQHEILHHLNAGDFDMSDLWHKGNINDMPRSVWGPQMLTPTDSRWDRIVADFYEGIANPAVSALSRTPAFRWNVGKASSQTKFVYDAILDRGLADEAHSILPKLGAKAEDFEAFHQLSWSRLADDAVDGDPWHALGNALKDGDSETANNALSEIFNGAPKLSDEELGVLRDWSANQHMAYSEWRDASVERGYRLTVPFIDDHRIRSQFQEYIGSLIPFWYAEEQFLKRMGRTLQQSPEAFRKAQLLMNGFRSMGVVRQDGNGREVIYWPGSEQALEVIGEAAELISGGSFSLPQGLPLTSSTQNLIQGWDTNQMGKFSFSPLVGIPTEFMARRFPEWADARPFGDQERPYLHYLLPSTVTKVYSAWQGAPDDSNIASATLQAAQMLAATGHGLPENATAGQREDYLADLRATARTLGVVRTLSSFLGAGNATPARPEYSEELNSLLRQGVGWTEAVARLIEAHGPSALPYTVFGTEKGETMATIPYTGEAADFMTANDDYIKAFPSAAPWLLPQEKAGDQFSSRAYNEALALKLRVRRSPEEMVRAIQIAQAAPDYWDKKREYEAKIAASDKGRPAGRKKTEATKMLEEEWSIWKDGYLAQHPVFAEDLTSGSGKQRREETLLEMRKIVHDPGAPKSEHMSDLREMVDAYWEYRTAMDALSGVRGKRATQMKQQLKDDFLLHHWLSVSPQAKAFYNSVIAPEVDTEPLPVTMGGA